MEITPDLVLACMAFAGSVVTTAYNSFKLKKAYGKLLDNKDYMTAGRLYGISRKLYEARESLAYAPAEGGKPAKYPNCKKARMPLMDIVLEGRLHEFGTEDLEKATGIRQGEFSALEKTLTDICMDMPGSDEQKEFKGEAVNAMTFEKEIAAITTAYSYAANAGGYHNSLVPKELKKERNKRLLWYLGGIVGAYASLVWGMIEAADIFLGK